MRLNFYLAHPFPERASIREWELELEKKLDIDLYNPFFDGWESTTVEEYNNKAKSTEEFSKFIREHSSRIVTSDLDAIEKADGMIAYLPYPSIGVSMEVFYCGWILKNPTLIYQPSYIYGKYERHPWLLECGRLYKTEYGLIRGIKRIKRKLNVK